MIILTDKAKSDFGFWLSQRRASIEEQENFRKLSETAQYAIIIEWFDSVGIFIEVGSLFDFAGIKFRFNILENNETIQSYYNKFDGRLLAVKEGISFANEIYNKR